MHRPRCARARAGKNLCTTLVLAAQAQLDTDREQKIAEKLPVRKRPAKVNATAALHLCKLGQLIQ